MYAFRILVSGVVFGKLILVAVDTDGLLGFWPAYGKYLDDQKQNYTLIPQSDLVIFGSSNYIWINGTQPVTYTTAPPNISFPFTRLASANSADQKTSFLYHQINHTTLAEEQWDKTEQIWFPTQYITVSES